MVVKKKALQLFEKKPADALRTADIAAQSRCRDVWKGIGPTPSCPFIETVMQNMQQVLVHGHAARESAALQVVAETAASYKKIISSKFIEEMTEVVTKAFPMDHYVQFAENTKSVYAQHATAQRIRFNESIFKKLACPYHWGRRRHVSPGPS